MKIDIEYVAFYGRCFDEYRQFFGLDTASLVGKSILDCPSGAASFAAEAAHFGIRTTAVDPMFCQPVSELTKAGSRDIQHVLEKARAVPQMYNWNYFKNYQELEASRINSLALFERDFIEQATANRYINATLPDLPFSDGEFDLVLSGHFLFCYGNRLSFDFHLQSIRELLRVSSGEVRIYPIRGLDAEPYSQYEKLFTCLSAEGIAVAHRRTTYEFIKGWNEMLIVTR